MEEKEKMEAMENGKKSREKTYAEIVEMLADNYKQLEHSIANQLLMEVSNHYATGGSYREEVWKSLFEMIVPKKYCIEQNVFIIDSYGHKSKEVDLAIFDELYTPYIFNYGKIKFIPIEAVAAVVECKSRGFGVEELEKWEKSIEDLMTSMDSVVRQATRLCDNEERSGTPITQTATRPIMIFCSLGLEKKNLEHVKKKFDLVLTVDENKKTLEKYIREEKWSLDKWNDSLNHAWVKWDKEKWGEERKKRKAQKMGRRSEEKETEEAKEMRKEFLEELKVDSCNEEGQSEENVLMSLIFQLNQLLMVINNPMFFPHHAYAECFNEFLTQSPQQGGPENAK